MDAPTCEKCKLPVTHRRLVSDPTTMPREMVWLVGGKKDSPFVDVYADEKDATAAVMGYLFDPHWFNKLSEIQRKTLTKLKDDPKLAIEYYNSVASDDDKWYLRSEEVRSAR